MIDREKFIGYETPAVTVDVEKGQLSAFAKATGNDDPIYSDEAAARAAGYPTIPAPPTFAFVLNSLARARAGPAGNYMAVLGVKVGSFLHGEQAFEYHKAIYAGDRITMKTKVEDIYDKKNGAMEFVVTTVDAVNEHGELCVRQRCNLVVRN